MADVMRALCVAMSLPLTSTCVFAVYRCVAWDQKLRFIGLAMIGVVVVAWQIEAWGHPLHWRVPILVLGLVSALAGTVTFLVRTRRDLED